MADDARTEARRRLVEVLAARPAESGADDTTTRPEPDYTSYPYSGYSEHEEWVRNGGSIVDGKPWGWL
jgi:hypothetical protein